MLETIANLNTNFLLILFAIIWVVVQGIRFIYGIWTQGKFEVGVAGDFDRVFSKLNSLESDISNLK
jgi:hypothetical protein